VILDLDADTARIVGLGVVTIRRDGVSMEIPTGETVPIDVLREGPKTSSTTSTGRSELLSEPVVTEHSVAATASKKIEASLATDVDRCSAEFDRSMAARDAAGAVAATLDLDDAIRNWSADTLQSDEMDKARALLRSMIVRLGEASKGGLTDPREVLGPLVEIALSARSEVRLAKLYDLSDQIRDGLAEAGVEVRDTADGQIWELIKPD
jgi:cysteinyl-tRNA synthetase